jgi:hypothetical protein
VDTNEKRAIDRAVKDALGGVGLTAFDKLPQDLRTQAFARYHERVAVERPPGGGHGQAVDPALRSSP